MLNATSTRNSQRDRVAFKQIFQVSQQLLRRCSVARPKDQAGNPVAVSPFTLPIPRTIKPLLTELGLGHAASDLLAQKFSKHISQLRQEYERSANYTIQTCLKTTWHQDIKNELASVRTMYTNRFNRVLVRWTRDYLREVQSHIAKTRNCEQKHVHTRGATYAERPSASFEKGDSSMIERHKYKHKPHSLSSPRQRDPVMSRARARSDDSQVVTALELTGNAPGGPVDGGRDPHDFSFGALDCPIRDGASPFDLERPAWAFPTTYMKGLEILGDVFAERHTQFVTPWPRRCNTAIKQNPVTVDVESLISSLGGMELKGQPEADPSHAKDQDQASRASCFGFAISLPKAPLFSLIRTTKCTEREIICPCPQQLRRPSPSLVDSKANRRTNPSSSTAIYLRYHTANSKAAPDLLKTPIPSKFETKRKSLRAPCSSCSSVDVTPTIVPQRTTKRSVTSGCRVRPYHVPSTIPSAAGHLSYTSRKSSSQSLSSISSSNSTASSDDEGPVTPRSTSVDWSLCMKQYSSRDELSIEYSERTFPPEVVLIH